MTSACAEEIERNMSPGEHELFILLMGRKPEPGDSLEILVKTDGLAGGSGGRGKKNPRQKNPRVIEAKPQRDFV